MQYVEIMYVSNAETNNVHLMHLDTVLTCCTHTVIALIIDLTISFVLNISYNNYNGIRQKACTSILQKVKFSSFLNDQIIMNFNDY